MSNETNLNAGQTNHIIFGKGRKMYQKISLMLIVAFAVGLFGTTAPVRALEVPDVRGMTEDDAKSAITSVPGLFVGAISYEYSEVVDHGCVVSQAPTGGTLFMPPRWVNLVICQKADVPHVVGMEVGAAQSAIEDAHLNPVIAELEYSDTVEEGHVISQDPPGYRTGGGPCPPFMCWFIDVWAPYDSDVELTVSRGCQRVDVPNVFEMAQADAESAITAAGLSVGTITEDYSHTVPDGHVMSQVPAEGMSVCIGSAVDLVICQKVKVPYVEGMEQLDARAEIRSVGLEVSWRQDCSDTVSYAHVISQDPAWGTWVANGSRVTLTISIGPCSCPKVDIPEVFEMAQGDAQSAITAAGLVVGTITHEYSDTVEDGHAISQNPAAGTSVCIGSAVDLVICQKVEVPDVVDWAQSAAESEITAAGLVVGTITHSYHNTVPEGHVISQDPAGGTSVRIGTAVDLTISLGPWTVPNVVGMSESDAASAINSAELSVGSMGYLYDDTVPAGSVISSYPAAGTVVDPGSKVDLDISMGPDTGGPTVEVPDVVGMTEADAKSVITSASLNVGTISNDYSDSVSKGFVISQYPSGGTEVSEGYSVLLTISLGPKPGDVPPVPVPPDASLLAHWKLDETSGITVGNSSGNGNHGILYGNPTWQPTAGIIDGALEFDGDGDYVEISKIGDSVEFTYAMWVAQNQIGSGFVALIDHKDWVYGSVQFELRDGHPKVGINGAITPAGDLDAWGHTLAAGEWHHVALAKSATKLLMYVDGEEAARRELITSDTVILGDGFIGAWVYPTWGQTRYFNGWVDEVRIYDRALDENQIKALISVTPSPDPLSEALDASLSFTTSGSADWFSQNKTSYNDGDAAQSGDISDEQESWIQTTVSGKGTVKFYWKVSSEENFDYLEFYIDGSLKDRISGSVNWQQKIYAISTSGSHTLEWRYMKDGVTSMGDDCGWVDKVEWVNYPLASTSHRL